jgi:hypothetical protein
MIHRPDVSLSGCFLADPQDRRAVGQIEFLPMIEKLSSRLPITSPRPFE